MQIFIDQSGKVEETGKATIVAYSNGKQKSLYISSSSKQKLQKVFRDAGKPTIFVYKTFAILIYLLIADDLDQIDSIIIDTEYVGYDPLIKNILTKIILRKSVFFDPNRIHFQQVGKNHKCHETAIKTYRGEKNADKVVRFEEILKYTL